MTGDTAAPEPPPSAGAFADALPGLRAYADLLAGEGVRRGLLGPREVERLWDRHLLNCAVVAVEPALVPPGATVVDVGSGAGLPGLVWALVRPDLSVVVVEPLLRRVTFLRECVERLGLSARVGVHRERAEALAGLVSYDVVTARAVAPMERLAGWTLPLARVGGTVLALKGSGAAAELAGAREELARWGGTEADVVECGVGLLDPPTTVVRVVRTDPGPASAPPRARAAARRRTR